MARLMDEAETRPRAAGEPVDLDALLAACRAGEPAAFERLFDLYKDYVYSVACYLSRDPDLAADVVQEVFLKLLERLDRFAGRARFTTWLYRVTCNAVWDRRRATRPHVGLAAVAAEAAGALPATQATAYERRELDAAVRRAVERLPPRLRTPLVLRYVAELSYEEVAAVLHLPMGTVASRLSRARRRLARELEPLKGGA